MKQIVVAVADKGGRGNVLANSLAKSPKVTCVEVIPGNAGSSLLPKCRQVSLKEIEKHLLDRKINPETLTEEEKIVYYVKEINPCDLLVVGPEDYLENGMINMANTGEFNGAVGPIKEAAILETSKCWTKEFLKRIGVRTAYLGSFADPEIAKKFIKENWEKYGKLVIKVDGTAAGKGTFLPDTLEQALYIVNLIMVQKIFGKAGSRIEIERRLYGQEIMFHVITDGKTILPLEVSMDYKRAFDEDDEYHKQLFDGLNPNTGGMGGFSPHPLFVKDSKRSRLRRFFEFLKRKLHIGEDLQEKIMKEIVVPTLTKFRELTGLKYKGILYFGLMICEENGKKVPYVLEINVRIGDPEAEVILPRLKTDLYDLMKAVVEERLHEIKKLDWDPRYCLAICAVSGTVIEFMDCIGSSEVSLTWLRKANGRWIGDYLYPGYPGKHLTGQIIRGLKDLSPDTLVFHNGTALKGKNIVVTGGRVATFVVFGDSLEETREKAYSEIRNIHFLNMRYLKDIGK